MSICTSIITVSDENLARFREQPALVWRLIDPDDPESYLDEAGLSEGADVPDLTLVDGEGDVIELDKAWDGLNFLISRGETEELAEFLVDGGEEVEADSGYGPGRAFTAEQTARIQLLLARLSPDDLRARFEPEQMMEDDVYPTIWTRDPDDDDTLGWLLESYDELRDGVKQAADRRLGLVVLMG